MTSDRPTPINLGPYALVGEIGRGGMGVVLKAIDTRNNRAVAIKLVHRKNVRDERARISLIREAGATACLRHPDIVSIYDVGQHKGNLYVVMEYLEGLSLEHLLMRQWPLSLRHRLQIIAELCDALGFAHEKGIVHRDIKPANIFVLRDGSTKILDFGLAAIAQIVDPNNESWSGTVPYMSPEQVRRANIDGRSDIWAAGVTLFRLLAGKLPFRGPTVSSIFRAILCSSVPEIPSQIPLSSELNRVIQRALHKDREQRYSTAQSFAAKLRELIPAADHHDWLPPKSLSVSEHIDQTTLIGFDLVPQSDQPRVASHAEDHSSQNMASPYPDSGTYRPPNLGFRCKPQGNVTITSRKLAGMAWKLKIRNTRMGALVVMYLTTILVALRTADRVDMWFFLIAIFLIAGVWLSLSVAIMVTWLVDEFRFRPRCPSCRRAMMRRTMWTGCMRYDTQVSLGFSDCVAALKSSFWEDAAQLLSIYGAQNPVEFGTSRTPFRYQLGFYECEPCAHRAARLTRDDLIAEKWRRQPQFVLAAQGPEPPSKTSIIRELATLPLTILLVVGNAVTSACREMWSGTIDKHDMLIRTVRVGFFVIFPMNLVLWYYYPQFKKYVRIENHKNQTASAEVLGDRAYFGFAGPRDLPTAAKYYKLAAERGDASSASKLGEMLEGGIGVPIDLNEARRWYEVAASKGNGSAQFHLGQLYEYGKGVPQDSKEAIVWYQRAWAAGMSDAQNHIFALQLQIQKTAKTHCCKRRNQ